MCECVPLFVCVKMSVHLDVYVLITLALRQLYSWNPFLEWLTLEGQQENAQNAVEIQYSTLRIIR